jgi:cyclic-di-GMP-binding protein
MIAMPPVASQLGKDALRMADSSFDVVSNVNRQEVDNALNQTKKELVQRFDFKNTGTSIDWSGDNVTIVSKTDKRAEAALDVFKDKLVRRKVSLKALETGEPKPAGGGTYRIECTFIQGIPEDKAKSLAKTIRQSGLKVQAQVQNDQLRVSSKSRDDLQKAIALLKDHDEGLPLQFTNYR